MDSIKTDRDPLQAPFSWTGGFGPVGWARGVPSLTEHQGEFFPFFILPFLFIFWLFEGERRESSLEKNNYILFFGSRWESAGQICVPEIVKRESMEVGNPKKCVRVFFGSRHAVLWSDGSRHADFSLILPFLGVDGSRPTNISTNKNLSGVVSLFLFPDERKWALLT